MCVIILYVFFHSTCFMIFYNMRDIIRFVSKNVVTLLCFYKEILYKKFNNQFVNVNLTIIYC